MRYVVVATSGWLLLVDVKTKKVQPLENDRPEYYGVSWFADSDELTLSHSGLDNATLVDIASYAQSECGWVSQGELRSPSFLSQPHQILCAPDGRIVCTNTGRNCVAVVDLHKRNLVQEARISATRWDRLSLSENFGDHLNSVFLRGSELFVLAHGHANGSKIATFTYPGLELVDVKPLVARTGLHNIWVTADEQLVSCHSETGSVVDLDSRNALWESGSDVYTRGLAATEKYVLVGESQKSGRELRRSSMSGLWVLDRESWQSLDYISLGPYGVVMEVRVLDEADDAHHGAPFAGLSNLLSRDALGEISRRRLLTSRSVMESARTWQNYQSIFGAPVVSNDGFKYAAVDQLSLVINQEVSPTQFSFAYCLDNDPQAHISAVLGYSGGGGDSSMSALLLRPVEGLAMLSIWRHDGQLWSLLPVHLDLGSMPLRGTVKLIVTESHVTVNFSNATSIILEKEMLHLNSCNYGLGIRWAGGSIRPVEDFSA